MTLYSLASREDASFVQHQLYNIVHPHTCHEESAKISIHEILEKVCVWNHTEVCVIPQEAINWSLKLALWGPRLSSLKDICIWCFAKL